MNLKKFFLRKKALVMGIILIFLILNTTAAASLEADTACTEADAAGISIGIIGDQTYAYDLQQAYTVLESGVKKLNTLPADVVVHIGDLLESSASEEEIRSQYLQGTSILDQLKVNWYLTAGDHDVNPPVYQQDSADHSREILYKELYGAKNPAVKENLWYSFNVKDYHIVVLDSHQKFHTDPRWGNIFLARIYDDQFEFLKKDLKNNAQKKGVIVFIHQPFWYHSSGWQRIHNLLKKYNTKAVVSGHFQYDQISKGTLDGIRYITVGATGGTTKQGSRDAGNAQHVSVLKVCNNGNCNIKLYSLSDSEPLEISAQEDMDRIQAVDVLLGELWNFESQNPLYLKNGQLVADCTSGSPAAIKLATLGNPTDLSLKVELVVSATDPGIVVESAQFQPDQCGKIISDYECILFPTSRIFYSNYSSVSVNTYIAPLWEAVLKVAGNPPAVGSAVNVNIKLTLIGASQENLYLTRTVTTTVKECPAQ